MDTIETDFVCVGYGLGGLTGAIVAHDAGQRVLVIEKSAKLGGVCAYSGGEVFLGNNHKMAEAGCVDSPERTRQYLDFLAGGYAEPALADVLFNTAQAAVKSQEDRTRIPCKIIQT